MNNTNETKVGCKVDACHFNDCGGNCTAGKIEVTRCGENVPEGTFCSTFQNRDGCDCGCR